ncbi:MAG TPA: PAS domain S-box protein [Flavisolibacter sp.]|nr:PAS domain S-box protein [Flavisolibacter sp.]
MDFRAFEATPGISVMIQPDMPTYTVIAVSNDFSRTFNKKRQDLVGSAFFDVILQGTHALSDIGAANLKTSFEYILKHKAPHEIPQQRFDLFNADGSFLPKYWKINNAPVLSDEGEVLYIIHTRQDITDQVLAEKRAPGGQHLEKAYHFFMSTPVIIGFVKGDEYIIELANEDLLEVWGRTKEVIGQPMFQAIPELEGQGFKALLDQVRSSGEPFYAYEYPITLLRQGKEEVVYFDFVYKPYYEYPTDEVAGGIIAVGYNVTDKVLAKKKIEDSEAYFRRLADTVPAAIWITEKDGGCSYLNKEWYELTGQLKEDALGLGWLNAVHPEDRPNAERAFLTANTSCQPFKVRYRLQLKDGTYKWVIDIGRPRYSADGSFEGYTGFILDIHEQVLAEQALKASEARLRRLADSNLIGIITWDRAGFVVEANEAFLQMVGYSYADLEANKINWANMTPPEYWPITQKALDELQRERLFRPFEKQFTCKDGSRVDVILGGAFYEDQPDRGICWVLDITEQKKLENTLKESQHKWKQIANVVPTFVWTAGPDGALDFLNEYWYSYTGLTEQESLGFGWTQVLHPDDVQRCLAVWENARTKEIFYEVEVRYRSKEGHYRWVISRGMPIKDDTGKVTAWYGTSADIHDQKLLTENLEQLVAERTAELKRSNEHLESFAHAASHDMKEPLRKIRTFADRIKTTLAPRMTEAESRMFDRIESAAERMQLLVDDLLEFSHVSQGRRQVDKVNLNDKVQKALMDLELPIEEKKAVINAGELPTIMGNRRQLQQLFQNLIGNALKYSKPGTPPEVTLRSRLVKGADAPVNLPVEQKQKMFHLIEVSDNGIGFEQQFAEQIFEMFQRLHGKAEYAGTGVGLSIARKVVQNHNGYIWATSELGKGATFYVLLPEGSPDL